MYEFDSVSVSSYEATSLAAKLSEKSRDGWEVVSIVSAGSDVVAYLKKSSAAATEVATATTTSDDSGAIAAPAEPTGWGSAPAGATTPSSSGDSGWGSTAAAAGTGAAAGSDWGSSGSTGGSSWGGGTTDPSSGWGTSSTSTPAATPTQPATPSVPPGWYADPAGRYELRYWDGSAWTEHVSRAGQQYTDPPVA